jgi:hypothetical protein
MTVKRHVVVIEDMRGDPIDERRIGNAAGFASRNKGRALSYGSSAKDPVHQTEDRLGRAGHHDRVAIGKAGLRDGPSPLGGGIEFESGDKASEVRSQMSHRRLLQGCPEAFAPRFISQRESPCFTDQLTLKRIGTARVKAPKLDVEGEFEQTRRFRIVIQRPDASATAIINMMVPALWIASASISRHRKPL